MRAYEDAYEEAVSGMVDKVKEAGTSLGLHKVWCGNCGKFLATAPYESIHFHNLLCVQCTDEYITVLGSLDSEGEV
tara:strand:+ start:85 stop:312 length:228 start_codon:yes stop_codon:yes gene_type:complete